MIKRVVVLGASGSGKSTLARALSETLGLPFHPTDNVYWRPDWSPTPAAEVRRWIEETTAHDAWVLDGNFDAQRDILWARAELAIWLDLPWTVTVAGVARRNFIWWATGAPVWGGLRMSLPKAWSGVRHASRSHGLKRGTYPKQFRQFPALQVMRVRSRRELARWLRTLEPAVGGNAPGARP